MSIQIESFQKISEELLPLLWEHWNEVANHKDIVALDPIWETYFQAEREQRLVTVTARVEGALVGYSIFFLRTHIHYSGCLVASNDVIFVRKAFRKGTGLGSALIKSSEAILVGIAALRNATLKICWHIKPAHDWSAILKRQGYKCEEIIMGKLIGEDNVV